MRPVRQEIYVLVVASDEHRLEVVHHRRVLVDAYLCRCALRRARQWVIGRAAAAGQEGEEGIVGRLSLVQLDRMHCICPG